jgi:hypothetical protein
MAPPCVICNHDQRAAIEADLIGGAPIRIVSDRYGISLGAINRHKAGHMASALEAVATRMAAEADRAGRQSNQSVVELIQGKLRELDQLKAQALRLGGQAEKDKKFGTAILGVGEARQSVAEQTRILKTLGQANGELPSSTSGVSVIVNQLGKSDQWQRVVKELAAAAVGMCPACRVKLVETIRKMKETVVTVEAH